MTAAVSPLASTGSSPARAPRSAVSWPAAFSALLLWAGLAAGGAWLILQGWPQVPQAPNAVSSVGAERVRVGALRQVLQAAPVAASVQPRAQPERTAAAAKVRVLGVVATESGQGAALLQVGKAPPQPFPPGAEVPGLGVVQSVSPTAIQIGASRQGTATTTLTPPESKPLIGLTASP